MLKMRNVRGNMYMKMLSTRASLCPWSTAAISSFRLFSSDPWYRKQSFEWITVRLFLFFTNCNFFLTWKPQSLAMLMLLLNVIQWLRLAPDTLRPKGHFSHKRPHCEKLQHCWETEHSRAYTKVLLGVQASFAGVNFLQPVHHDMADRRETFYCSAFTRRCKKGCIFSDMKSASCPLFRVINTLFKSTHLYVAFRKSQWYHLKIEYHAQLHFKLKWDER